jgi:hypothetical protein
LIAQVLHRDFLLSQAGATQAGVGASIVSRSRRGGAPSPLDRFTTDELRDLSSELAAAISEAQTQTAESKTSKDAYAYVPRSPLLSIVQSAFEEYFETQRPNAIATKPVADDGRRSRGEPVVTDVRLEGVPLPVDQSGRRAWGKFEVTHPKVLSDPGWVWSLVAQGRRSWNGRVPFNASPPEPIRIANDARLVIVGDWGSGLDRAQHVAKWMRRALDDGIAERKQQWVIHLGDVYYSGTPGEYERRFLNYWPVTRGEDIASFALNGNHDMYWGGEGYFGTCLGEDPRFARQAGCSFFKLENDDWQILALDSSYEDGGLYGDQDKWVAEQLRSAGGKKTMLLSHHQFFSAYEPGSAVLRQKLSPVIEAHGIDAWFWGHEHRCLVYGPHENVQFASCVGHGGIPEYLIAKEGDPYPSPLVYDYRLVHGNGLEPWDTFGFAVVDLVDGGFEVQYIDEDGNRHHDTTFPS